MELYRVSQVAAYLKELLESDLHLADLWVSGEVGTLSRSAQGHTYFTLKDENAQLRCVLFRRASSGVPLEVGAQVIAHGRISLYEVRGELQFVVDFVQPEGVGVLHAQFERLKAQLEEEGLFAPERKRPLPAFPSRVGVVTSPAGAVFHDICHVLARRWPLAEVVLAPTPVQGEGAAESIAATLDRLNAEPGIDVIILARGGGSLEELWPFNEEAVARAVYRSRAPVVSGVGHETDYTIADFVADLRAPTPSAAAEVVVPDRADMSRRLAAHGQQISALLAAELQGCRSVVAGALHRLERGAPSLEMLRHRLTGLARTAGQHAAALAASRVEQLRGLRRRLAALSPQATLGRGYALVQRQQDGSVVSRTAQAPTGTGLRIRVSDGSVPAVAGTTTSRRRPRRERAASLQQAALPLER